VERRLYLLLHRAQRALNVYANAQTLDAIGITASQLATLHYLAKNPGCSMTALANLLDANKSAVTGLIQRLERAGLVRRVPDPADGRASVLSVTRKGEQVRERSGALLQRLNAELTEGFSTGEVDTVARFLNAVVERCSSTDERFG
jgi:MarR family transcriptional regulator, organic hydroperoxide resistance regulator